MTLETLQRPEQLVSQIRDAMSRADGQRLPQETRALAEAYAQAVTAVNHRLSDWVAILRQGLRSEALHGAELPPAVLEQAAQLDFRDLPLWKDMCQHNQWPVPPEINAPAAIELDEAFEQEQRLQEALTRHRRLALMRAPLSARLKILRRLRQMDPDNLIWQKDLRDLEQARQKQMMPEAMQLHREQNIAGLQALLDELMAPWENAPAPMLVQDIQKLLNQRQAQQTKAAIGPALERLEQALASEDLEQIAAALAQHESLLPAGQSPGSPDQWPEPVRQAKKKLNEQARLKAQANAKTQSLAKLEAAAQDGTDTQTLANMAATAEAQGLDVPATVTEELARREAEAEQAKQKKKTLVIAAAVAGIGMVGGVGAAVWWHQSQNAKQDATEIRLQQSLASGDVNAAWSQWQAFSSDRPSWAKQARFVTLGQQITNAKNAQTQAEQAFATRLEQLQKRPAATVNTDDLRDLKAMAVNGQQSSQAQQLADDIAAAKREAQAQRESQIHDALARIRTRLAALNTQALTPDDQQTLQGFQTTLATYGQVQNLSTDTAADVASLKTQVDQILANLAQKDQQALDAATLFSQLAKQIDTPTPYFQTLLDWLRNHPNADTALRGELSQVIQSAPHTADVFDWIQALSAWVNPGELKQIQNVAPAKDGVSSYLSKHPQGQFQETARTAIEYLSTAQRALDPDNNPTAPDGDVQLLLTAPTVQGLKQIPLSQQGVWYTADTNPGQPTLPGKRVYRIFEDWQSAQRGQLSDKTLDDDEVLQTTPQTAPVAVFAQKAQAFLQDPSRAWQTTHTQLLAMLVQHPGIDPIQKLRLAKDLGSLAQERDWPIPLELAEWLKQLGGVETDANWLNPTHPQSQAAREIADAVLQQAPDWQAIAKAQQSAIESLSTETNTPQPVAVLTTNQMDGLGPMSEPRPLTVLTQKQLGEGLVWAIQRQNTTVSQWQKQPIAVIQNSRWFWQPETETTPRGALLFFEPTASETQP